MSSYDKNKTLPLRRWDPAEEKTIVRHRSSGSTGRLRAVRDIHLVAQDSGHNADDTIVVSTPYAFQANAALELASRIEEPVVATPAPAAPIAPVMPDVAPEHAVTDPHAIDDASGIRQKFTKPLIDTMKLNKLVVSSYKIMGFAVLATILLGLGSFIATNVFYMFNESWITPMQLSSTDPRVLQLTAQYSAAKAARDGVEAQQLELKSRLSDAQRIAVSEGKFQASFDDAMKAIRDDRVGQLGALRQLIHNISRTRRDVSAANKAYTSISKDQLEREYSAGLIDKDAQVKGGYELAEIQGANLGLHQKSVEADAKVVDLQREVASLDTVGAHKSGAMSYEVLHMHHEYEQSVLAAQKAADEVDALSKSVTMFDKTLADYDSQLERIAKAPYVQAADKSVTTAFVPYDNVGAVQVGDAVYKCAVAFLFCRKVGTVAEMLDGEILGKHPLHNREMRGVLVRLQLADPRAIEKPVLHLHRAPLGI